MTNNNDTPKGNVGNKNTEGLPREVSRRKILGSGVIAALGGLAGCSERSLYGSSGGSIQTNSAGTEQPTTSDTDMNSERESLWATEEGTREQQLEPGPASETPSYDYDSVEVNAGDGDEAWITRIIAAPAQSATGDRIVIHCRTDYVEQISELLVSYWTTSDPVGNHETTIDGQTVQFSIFSNDDIVISRAIRPVPESENTDELLLVRSPEEDKVINMSDSFTRIYEQVPSSSPDENERSRSTLEVTKEGSEEGVGAHGVSVSGDLEPQDNPAAVVEGSSALDWVGPKRGTDTYQFSGELNRFLLKGQATVYLDGDEVNPAELGASSSASGTSGFSNTLTVAKENTPEGRCAYMVTVSGDIERGDSSAAVIEGSSALDWVGPKRGTDSVRFSGEVTEFLIKGSGVVYLNGEEVDPEDL